MNKKQTRREFGATALATVLASAMPAPFVWAAEKKYDPGSSDTEIKLGQTVPHSGPGSIYGVLGRVGEAYFQMLNEKGGINGRKVKFLTMDDAYSAPKCVEATRRLVEQDEVLALFGSLGTAPQTAVHKYLNSKGVPQLLLNTGASKWNDPKNNKWTMAGLPLYPTEARILAKHVVSVKPNAKIGILYQNDDLGKDYINGLKAGLGDKAAKMIVAEASYEVSDPTIDSQVLKIKDAGATLFYSATTPKQAAQAIRKIHELNWKPVHILDINASPVSATLQPAGLEASKGVISVNYGKDPADPTWKGDAGLQKYLDFMAKYFPEGDKMNTVNTYGYSTAQLLVQVLKQCGDDLTRENVMKQAASLKDVVLDLGLPGMKINTGPDDYRVNKQLQMMKFNGERWELFGPILEDAGPAG